jgi:hypothetical protein
MKMICRTGEWREASTIDDTDPASPGSRTPPRSEVAAGREGAPAKSEASRLSTSGVRRIVEFICGREGEQGV